MTDLNWPDLDAAYYEPLHWNAIHAIHAFLNFDGYRFYGSPDTHAVTIIRGQAVTNTLSAEPLHECLAGYSGFRWGVRSSETYNLAYSILTTCGLDVHAVVYAGAFSSQVLARCDADKPLVITSRDIATWLDEQEGEL